MAGFERGYSSCGFVVDDSDLKTGLSKCMHFSAIATHVVLSLVSNERYCFKFSFNGEIVLQASTLFPI